jgi:flavin-dependent dehydrogenase
MLLENAAEKGVSVQHGVRVLEVLFDGNRAHGVKVQMEDGTQREIHAKVVVDASGQSSLIMDRLKLRQWDPQLKKAAVWTYFKGALRDTGKNEGVTLVMQTQGKAGWFWYIPLHDDIVSCGVVSAHDQLFRPGEKRSYEEIYQAEVDRCPGLVGRISLAERVTDFYAAKEYSYKATQAAGDGWVLVGDAYGFLDPLYSSGVLLALTSGQRAADAILEGFAKGDWSASQLGSWQADYDQGMARMRRLVVEFYDGFSFGRFVKRYPHLKGLLTDLLIGDLFKGELDEVFDKIEEMKAEDALAASGGRS